MPELAELFPAASSWHSGDEPLSGYHLIEPLGRGGFGEVWKCSVPGGFLKAIKFVEGDLGSRAGGEAVEVELEALRRIKTIRHPFLLSTERVEQVGKTLVVVMELADRNLLELVQEHRQAGRPGVPREHLLALMLEAAEALDFLNLHHGLQHLDVKPANLFVLSNHLKVGDFGLVSGPDQAHRADPMGKPLGLTPRYVPPERLSGGISRHCDQYSLAVVYQELLTGVPPIHAQSAAQISQLHLKGRPNLEPLPAADRPIVARALAKEPEERFPSCSQFIQALVDGRDNTGDRSATQTPTRQIRNLRNRGYLTPSADGTNAIPVLDMPTPSPRLRPTFQVHASIPVDANALPGYTLGPRQGCGPLGEVYLVRSPDGPDRLARFMPGLVPDVAHFQEQLTARLVGVAHPALPPTDVLCGPDGRIAVISDCEPRTLRDRLRDSVARGRAGIPRPELLQLLRPVAEALDDLAQRTGLHHRALHPSRIVPRPDGVWIMDWGLVDLFEMTTGQALAPPNARYAALDRATPEARATADVYSLALIYAEMLTGCHPLARGRGRQPDLDLVPTADRPVLARALLADPRHRFAGCTEFIQALETAGANAGPPAPPAVVAVETLLQPTVRSRVSLPTVPEFVREALLIGAGPMSSYQDLQFVLRPGQRIEHRCSLRGPLKKLGHRLDAFRDEWGAEAAVENDSTFLFHVPPPGRLWQSWWKRQAGLVVFVQILNGGREPRSAEALIQISPSESVSERNRARLQEMGPVVLQSLLAHLPTNAERRTAARWPFPYPVQVFPVGEGQGLAGVLEGEGRDLSFGGVGIVLPQPPPSELIYVRFPALTGLEAVAALARVVRVQPLSEDRCEIGAAWTGLA